VKCYSCRGKLEASTVSDFNDLGTSIIFVRGIPCHKCTQCGESVFDLKVETRVEEIMDTLKNSLAGEIAVVQYSPFEINVVKYSKMVAA